jgi:hypothetical protein
MMKKFTFLVGVALATLSGTAQISTFPYMEDFEAETTCGSSCGSACNTLIDWNNSTTDDLDWLVDVGGTGSGGTGPTANGGADHTTGTGLGKYVFVETSCSGVGFPNFQADLESPWFDFIGQTSMNLTFWYHAYGATTGNLNVEARIGSLGAWNNITGPITDNQDLWQEWSGCLGVTYSGVDSVQLRFTYVTGTSFTGDLALDDITIAPVNPTDVGVTAVVLPGGCGLTTTELISITVCNFGDTLIPGTTIPVTYVLDGGTPVSETITLTAGLGSVCLTNACVNYTFTTTVDLTANGAHTVVAWSSMAGDGFFANDTSIGSAITIPLGGAIPYFENFEAGLGGWIIDNATNGSLEYGNPANTIINSAASGDSAIVTNLTGDYNTNEDGNITSPCIDISSANGSEVVVIKAWWNSEFSWDGANIFSSVDGGLSWAQIGAMGDPTNWYNDNSINGAPQGSQEGWTGRASSGNGSAGWVAAEHTLDSAMMVNNGSMLLRIGFGSDGSVQDEGFGFDDIAIGYPTLTYNFGPDSIMAVCDTSYTFDAGPGYGFYHWSDLTNNSSGVWANTQTFTVTVGGTYVVTVSDTSGMIARDTVYLELLNFVRPNLLDVVTCFGDSAMFDADPGIVPANTFYSWSTGDTTQTSWLFTPGNISVTKTDTSTGCAVSDTATFSSNVPITLADITICIGDTAIINATTANATYLWNTGDTTAMISTPSFGTFYVTVTDTALGCPATTDTMDVIVNPLPDVTVSTSVNLLTANNVNAGVTYQWLDCNNNFAIIPGETGQSYTVTVNGDYAVEVTENGCVDTSICTNVLFVSVNELNNGVAVKLFPNPTKGELTLTLSQLTEDGIVTILNIYGQVVRTEVVNSTTTKFDLNNLSDGSYILKLQINDSIVIDKFIINR